MSFWSLAFTSNCGSTCFVAFVWSPADIVKANNFYHTHSEIAFWGQWWILESVTTFSSSKSQVSIQEYASAAPSRKLESAMIQYTFKLISYPPPTVTIVESPDMKSSLALRFLLLSSSSSSESGCTHGKCSMPDIVCLEEKLFRCYILISAGTKRILNLGSRKDYLKRKHSPVPKYLILIPLSSIWLRSPQLVEQKAPKIFAESFQDIFSDISPLGRLFLSRENWVPTFPPFLKQMN